MRLNGRMRLWSVHPSLLDRRALVACWREGLLAQKVLLGRTKGYTNHPQLERFRATSDPVASVVTYLHGIADEADRRGYSFDRTRLVGPLEPGVSLTVTDGQLAYESTFLLQKVLGRDPGWAATTLAELSPEEVRPHPVFVRVEGPVASWERVKD